MNNLEQNNMNIINNMLIPKERPVDSFSAKELLEACKQKYEVMKMVLKSFQEQIDNYIPNIKNIVFTEGLTPNDIGLLITYLNENNAVKEIYILCRLTQNGMKYSVVGNNLKTDKLPYEDALKEYATLGIKSSFNIEPKLFDTTNNFLVNVNNSNLKIFLNPEKVTDDNFFCLNYDFEKNNKFFFSKKSISCDSLNPNIKSLFNNPKNFDMLFNNLYFDEFEIPKHLIKR